MVFIYAEQENDKPKKISLELLGKGKEFAEKLEEKLEVAVFGPGDPFREYADKVYSIEGEYSILTASQTLPGLVGKHSIVLFGATEDSLEIAGRTAVRLKTGLVTNSTGLYLEDDKLYAVKPILNGTLNATYAFEKNPGLAIVMPGSFAVSEGGYDAEIVTHAAALDTRMEVLDRKQEQSTVDLKDARALVVVGRGIKGKDNGETGLKLVQELAKAINGEVGASRAAVDLGIIEESRQIGQTGEIVSPKVIFELGVSGAIQHVVGMKNSDMIIAVNKDEGAPIFRMAHYGIVGDLFDVLPELVEKYK